VSGKWDKLRRPKTKLSKKGGEPETRHHVYLEPPLTAHAVFSPLTQFPKHPQHTPTPNRRGR
jgi:hypothetical protein